jgi:membrane-bound lytic murein transglycosylase D
VPTSKAQLLTASLQTMRPDELISPRSLKPVFEGADPSEVAQLKRAYRVKRGDNLGSIAKANKVEVKDLQRWNKLTGKNLKVGQTLVMQDTTKRAPARKSGRVNTVIASNSKSKGKDDSAQQTQYKVKRGDTLYVVAKRFNVEMQHLKRWNPGAGKALKPGQMLTVYQPH